MEKKAKKSRSSIPLKETTYRRDCVTLKLVVSPYKHQSKSTHILITLRLASFSTTGIQ
jgi:hypothetical protein